MARSRRRISSSKRPVSWTRPPSGALSTRMPARGPRLALHPDQHVVLLRERLADRVRQGGRIGSQEDAALQQVLGLPYLAEASGELREQLERRFPTLQQVVQAAEGDLAFSGHH